VNIRRVPSTTLDKDVLVYRILNFFTISLSIFFSALWQVKRHHVVVVVTNPPLLPFLAVLVCKLKGAKSLLLIHDVYPEILIHAGITGPNSLISRVGYWATRTLYRSADRLIVLGRDMGKLASLKLGRSNGKVNIIPNWADLDLITPRRREDNRLLKELNLADQFVIQYSGNMGRTHGLADLFQAAKTLKESRDIHFLFIGSGAKKRWLEKMISDEQLQNSTILPPRPKEELPDSLNACDVALIAFSSGMSGVSVPSRMYNIMAAGKPIIAVADADSELALVIAEEDAGWVVPPGLPDNIVDAMLYACSHPGECRIKGLNGRRAVEKKYSFGQALTAYEQLIEEFLTQ
jgi:glycosyltransferase involved in cell wall biosynthesis